MIIRKNTPAKRFNVSENKKISKNVEFFLICRLQATNQS